VTRQVVTAKRFTVGHDPTRPANSRIGVWYNADINPNPADLTLEIKLAYLESSDAIH
jgi:hypothetical protein